MNKFLKISSICIGILGILNSIFAFIISNINLGTAIPGLIGILLLIYGIFQDCIQKLSKKGIFKVIFKIIKIGLIIFSLTFIICIAILLKYAHTTPSNGADAVIVLGAGLKGENVSTALAYRLDAGAKYLEKNPNCIIVVSGGQGSNEIVSEAYAMKNYLLQKGIPENKIIMEDKSSRTLENFTFSKKILDNYFGTTNYKIVYATNDFHIFRAGKLAKKVGFNAEGLTSPSTPYLRANYYIKEYFSVIKYYLVDNAA